jgi:hypothetical protein
MPFLSLLVSPIGRWAAALLFAMTLIGAAYLKGRADRAALDESAALRASNAALVEQLDSTRKVADAANARAERAAADQAATTERIADYETALARRPNGACALSPDDARRLLGIGDGPQADPAGGARRVR